MSRWMRRRIERSRARCQRTAAARNPRKRHGRPRPEPDKQTAASNTASLPAAPWRSPESQVV